MNGKMSAIITSLAVGVTAVPAAAQNASPSQSTQLGRQQTVRPGARIALSDRRHGTGARGRRRARLQQLARSAPGLVAASDHAAGQRPGARIPARGIRGVFRRRSSVARNDVVFRLQNAGSERARAGQCPQGGQGLRRGIGRRRPGPGAEADRARSRTRGRSCCRNRLRRGDPRGIGKRGICGIVRAERRRSDSQRP